MNILVLYSRFSAYVNASFSYYANAEGVDVHIVRKPTDKDSPFKLESNPHLFFYDREEVNLDGLKQIIDRHNIKVVVCSGWGDQLYMKLAKWAFRNKLLTICVADNQWMGTLKQRLLGFFSPWILKARFVKLWVPGIYQFEYARRLGFARYDIMLRFYTADTSLFIPKEAINVPARFIYVGRLLEIKGIQVLYNAIVSMIPDLISNNWRFLVIGNGDMQNEFIQLAEQFKCIEYHPFLQPQELAEKTADGGIFVLPSNYDAWAVVVHEYALLGSPLLLSEAVGSRSAFLIEGYNGKVFVTGSSESLRQQCNLFIGTERGDLNKMGERSQSLAAGYNLDVWHQTLKSTIVNHFAGVKYTPLKRTKYQ